MSELSHPPSLRELQEWMRWVVTDPRGLPAALDEPHPLALGPRYQAPARDQRGFIAATSPNERERRLAVYAEAYFHRILNSLEEDFPASVRLLGHDDFARLINDYLKHFPTHSFTLAEAGRSLSAFALSEHPLEPWLAELLELEWRMLKCFYAPRVASLSREMLLALPADADWARAVIRFRPGVFVLKCHWPVAPFKNGRLKPADLVAAPMAEASFVLVRPLADEESTIEELGSGEGLCLAALMGGEALELALGRAADVLGDSASETLIGSWFARWTELGLIRQIDFPYSNHGAHDV